MIPTRLNYLNWKPYATVQNNWSLFCPIQTSSPSPSALCNPGLVDVVRWLRGRLRVAPRKLAATTSWRDASHSALCTIGLPPSQRFGFSRADSISPRTATTLYPTSHCHAAERMGWKEFNPIKTKKKTFKCQKCWPKLSALTCLLRGHECFLNSFHNLFNDFIIAIQTGIVKCFPCIF